MRIEQLQYVAAAIESGSLRRASEQLHVSQPAVSQGIVGLERELGVELLERHRTGARASTAGRQLLPHILEALSAIEAIRIVARDELATRRQLRVGTVNAGTAALLMPATRALHERHQGTAVEIRNLQQHEITTSLLEGTLDLGLINLLEGDDVPPELAQLKLLAAQPVVVLPTGHPLTAKAAIDIDDLREESFVGMREGFVMYRLAHRLFGPHKPRTWHTADGAEMGKLMVAQGLGLTILPAYSVYDDPLTKTGLVTTRPLSGRPPAVSMIAVYRPQRRTPPALADILNELARGARTPNLADAIAETA